MKNKTKQKAPFPVFLGVQGGHVASSTNDSQSSVAGLARVLCSSYPDREAPDRTVSVPRPPGKGEVLLLLMKGTTS